MSPKVTTDWIGRWARYTPQAIVFDDLERNQSISYQQANKVLCHLAGLFDANYQIQKGDRIAVLATNIFEYAYLLFLAQKLGAILVPINFRLTSPELEHVFSDCEPKLTIVESQFVDKIPAEHRGEGTRLLYFDKLSQAVDNLQSWVDSTPNEVAPFVHRSEPSDPCLILYTSGTTGSPKGAVHTNASIFWNSINTGLRLNLTQADVTVNFAPFFHTGGWNVLTTPLVHHGGRIGFLSKFDAKLVLNAIEKQSVTIFFGVPTTLSMMSDQPEFLNMSFSSVRYAIVGGEPMPIPQIETWAQKGVPIRQGYGLTEYGPNVFSLNEEDAIRKKGSIGFANFYCETKVVSEDGGECGVEEVGELALSGPMMMEGYWRNPEATEKNHSEWMASDRGPREVRFRGLCICCGSQKGHVH
jgi:fatty-acyl-CoA synthase